MLKEQGSSNSVHNMGHKGPVWRPRCIGPGRARTQIPLNSIQFKASPTYLEGTWLIFWNCRLGMENKVKLQTPVKDSRILCSKIFYINNSICHPNTRNAYTLQCHVSQYSGQVLSLNKTHNFNVFGSNLSVKYRYCRLTKIKLNKCDMIFDFIWFYCPSKHNKPYVW
jgi:hypothetical protein